jgi:hypothetical protein
MHGWCEGAILPSCMTAPAPELRRISNDEHETRVPACLMISATCSGHIDVPFSNLTHDSCLPRRPRRAPQSDYVHAEARPAPIT